MSERKTAPEMEIYALVGRRGTGKSHHAQLLAHRYEIAYLLDDGLLIRGNQILAGRSAKRENTRYGAIKRALLHDDEHAGQLREMLHELAPPKRSSGPASCGMKKIAMSSPCRPLPSRRNFRAT